MVRLVVYLFFFVILISLARVVVNLVGKAFSQAVREAGIGARANGKQARDGELRRDPVCGTYISTSTTLQAVSGGTTFYFCSPECRKRFEAAN